MNNYQSQQFWNDINGIIGFTTSIMVLGFLFGMTRGITKPIGNPNTKALPPAEEVKGTCYEDAWRFLIKQEEGELVHGTVESLGKRIGHAWVELDTGFIYEPQTARFFEPDVFKRAFSPVEDARYTVEEAAIMVARVGKHGPWTDEERTKWLPEHHSSAWRGKGNLIDVIIREVKAEIKWGEGEEGMKQWLVENEGLRRRDETSWGKIENGYVTLFHGTHSSIVPRILQEGLVQRYEMIGKTKEELTEEEREDVREMDFEYGVWFAATPYGAFFYNDTALQVRVPLTRIVNFDESGFVVGHNIPPEMIVRVIPFREWTGEEWSG